MALNAPLMFKAQGTNEWCVCVMPRVLHVPAAPGLIISHAVLEENLGWEVLYKRRVSVLPDGTQLPISHPRGDMYYHDVAPPPTALCNTTAPVLMSADVGYANIMALL